jgi:cysteine-rich repeat protein
VVGSAADTAEALAKATYGVPTTCGNGVVESPEQCDDGNDTDTDACTARCRNALCGDALVQEGVEECDDANIFDDDACVQCRNARCGDGFVQDGLEECDDGNDTAGDGCTGCTVDPVGCSGDIEVTVSVDYDETSFPEVQGVELNLHYPSAVSIPGSGEEASVQGRVTDLGAAAILQANDADTNADGQDDRLRIVYAAAGNIPPRPLVRVAFDCEEATTLEAADFPCEVTGAADPLGLPVIATCSVALGGGGPVCGNGVREGAEECDDGSVVGGDCCSASCRSEVCDDGNPCTDDACAAGVGCTHTPNAVPCSDGNACTTNDTCSGGGCVGGPAPNCNDNNPCTNDACDPATGCVNVLIPNCESCDTDADCNNHNACDGVEACVGGFCESAPALTCDDANPCTDDGCDPATGCTHTANTASCDDGSACTAGDVCSSGACAGTPVSCDDGNACTDDACQPATGCTHTSNTAPCNDGDPCTPTDTCDGAGLCTGGGTLCGNGDVDVACGEQCDDGNTVPDDGCTDCVNETAVCGDGVREGTEECDDGNEDNIDACTNACVSARCGDGFVYEGVEECDDGNAVANDGCTDCVSDPPVCGNGRIEVGETCDDGNTDTGDDCPPSCRIESCTPSGTRFAMSVNLARPGDVQIGGVVVFLDYPDGRVGIPGKLGETSVRGRISNIPGGFSGTPSDLDYALREAVGASSQGTALTVTRIFSVSFDLCVGATAPTPADFACTVEAASSPGGADLPLNGITCAATVP